MQESSRPSQFYEGRLNLLQRLETRYYERSNVFANHRVPVIQANQVPRRAPAYVPKHSVTNSSENLHINNEKRLRDRWLQAREDAQQRQEPVVYLPSMPKVINMHGHTTKGIPFQRYVDLIVQNKNSQQPIQPETFAKRKVAKKDQKPTAVNISEMLVVGAQKEDESVINGSVHSMNKHFILPKLAKLPDTFNKGKSRMLQHKTELSKMVKFSEAERILGVQLKRPRLEHEDRKFVHEITKNAENPESSEYKEIKKTNTHDVLPQIELDKNNVSTEVEDDNGSRTTSRSTFRLKELKMPAPVTKIIFENQQTMLKRLENAAINKKNSVKRNRSNKPETIVRNVVPTAYKRVNGVIGSSNSKLTKPLGSVVLNMRSDLKNTKFPDYINFQNSRTGGQSRILLSLKHKQHVASLSDAHFNPYGVPVRNSVMSIRGASSTSWFENVSGNPVYQGPKPTPVAKFRKLGNIQIYLNDSEY
uniref:uncharacterized protein LOC100184839 isoform X2 n=1 Tax=Ciona intestinalis TaxID=7719 RepID=UPI000EF46036|nr:uncharacterized protein LOC100184839 isoform X2 [Ciona intestinalis]|eukprot:XP_026690883.1 uncharacterized protein LOC100184839 isoform X2 [Ciona intestinalis]